MFISYSAAQDPFHAIFRILCILQNNATRVFELERLLITDFFVCFPWAVPEISGSRKVKGFIQAQNQVTRTYKKSEYEQLPERRVMFRRMRPSQLAALNSLCSYGYIGAKEFQTDKILRTQEAIPSIIATHVGEHVSSNEVLFSFLNNYLNELPMSTSDGLKAKTGLEEFRYDYI